jgi:hypothetical protein
MVNAAVCLITFFIRPLCIFSFLAALGFELRASRLLGSVYFHSLQCPCHISVVLQHCFKHFSEIAFFFGFFFILFVEGNVLGASSQPFCLNYSNIKS